MTMPNYGYSPMGFGGPQKMHMYSQNPGVMPTDSGPEFQVNGQMPAPPPGMPGQQQPVQQVPTVGGGPGGLTPEQANAIMSLQGMKAQQSGIDRQRKVADMLRLQGQDQLKMIDAGRFKVAPTGLNLAADIYSKYAAHQQDQNADANQKALSGQESDAQRAYFESLTGRKFPKPEQPPQQPAQQGGLGGLLQGFMGGGGSGAVPPGGGPPQPGGGGFDMSSIMKFFGK